MSEPSSSPSSDAKLTKVFSRTPSSWDPQDDLLLRHLKEQQKLGWKEIASHFAHRTPNACQFRWRRLRSGSLKTSTNSPTPTSGANTPTTIKTQESSSNSASPPQTSTTLTSNSSSSTKDKETGPVPLVSKFSSKPKERKSSSTPIATSLSSSNLSNSNKSNDIVPTYKWSFDTNQTQSTTGSISEQRRFKDSIVDPLNSSTFQDIDSDDEKNSSVLIEQADWTMDEDELLASRRSRALSFAELSILLPSRSEGEIINRIGELERKHSSVSITPKIKRSSSTTTSSRHHSHPNPLHTPSHSSHSNTHMSPSHNPTFTRSYSSSSQTSLSRSNSTTSTTNQFFLSQDSLRSKSFSYITPYVQSTDRYNLRKNSITNSITINQEHKSRTRSNSFLTNPRTRSNSFLKEHNNFQSASPVLGLSGHVLSNDRERLKRESSSSDAEDEELKIEPKLPPLGSIFNDIYSK